MLGDVVDLSFMQSPPPIFIAYYTMLIDAALAKGEHGAPPPPAGRAGEI
jgi:hypothetical protein